jgi:hypothetical protein
VRAIWLLGALLIPTVAAGQDRPAVDHAPHGGQTYSTPTAVFEVVLTEDTIRVYATDPATGEAISTRGLRGQLDIGAIRLQRQGDRTRRNHQASSATLRYVAASSRQGRLRDHLAAAHGLNNDSEEREVLSARLAVTVTLQGQSRDQGSVEFEVGFNRLSPARTYSCACHDRAYEDPGRCPECNDDLHGDEAEGDAADTDAGRDRRRRRNR